MDFFFDEIKFGTTISSSLFGSERIEEIDHPVQGVSEE